MKAKVSRVAVLLGLVAAVATLAAPAGAAGTRSGISVEPPWGQFCAGSFGVMCVPTPGPFAV
jgi:hypothetical protein